MKGLGKIDQVHDAARKHKVIQLTDSAHTHNRTPVRMLLQGGCQLRLALHRKHLVSVAFHRILQA